MTWEKGKRNWIWSLPDPLDSELPEPEPHELLAQLLDDYEKTAAELARETGFAQSTIDALLSGKQKMTAGQAQVLADAFELSADVFMPNGADGAAEE